VNKLKTYGSVTYLGFLTLSPLLYYGWCMCYMLATVALIFINTSLMSALWKYGMCYQPNHRLHWLPIDARIKFKIATLAYKALHTGNPPYLASLLHRHNPCRALRSASANVLSVTRSNLSFGSRAFRAAGPTVWNSLPPHVRWSTTPTTFRKHLKSHLFQSSFPTA